MASTRVVVASPLAAAHRLAVAMWVARASQLVGVSRPVAAGLFVIAVPWAAANLPAVASRLVGVNLVAVAEEDADLAAAAVACLAVGTVGVRTGK